MVEFIVILAKVFMAAVATAALSMYITGHTPDELIRRQFWRFDRTKSLSAIETHFLVLLETCPVTKASLSQWEYEGWVYPWKHSPTGITIERIPEFGACDGRGTYNVYFPQINQSKIYNACYTRIGQYIYRLERNIFLSLTSVETIWGNTPTQNIEAKQNNEQRALDDFQQKALFIESKYGQNDLLSVEK